MAYSKKIWNTGDLITASDMNRIEDGVNASQSMYNFRGSCTLADLPKTGNNVNDTFYVTDKKASYTWDGVEWIESGSSAVTVEMVETEVQNATKPLQEAINGHAEELEEHLAWLRRHDGQFTGLNKELGYYLKNYIKPSFRYKGSLLSFELPSLSKAEDGDVYRLTDAFVTDDSFLVGAGVSVPAGVNVVKVTDKNDTYTPVSVGAGESGDVIDETCTELGDTQGAAGYAHYDIDLSKLDKSSSYRLISYRPEAGNAITGRPIPGYVIGNQASDYGYMVDGYEETPSGESGKKYSATLQFGEDAAWLFINVKNSDGVPTLEKITKGTEGGKWNILSGI